MFPLGLAFLAGQMGRFDVSAVDPSLDGTEAVASALDSLRPDVVAISLRNIDDSSWPRTWSYLEPFEEILSRLSGFPGTVIVGGPGFSIYARELMARHPRIDIGIAGEGEAALPEVLSGIASGTLPESALIEAPMVDLSSISPPRYDILDLKRYERGFGIGVQSRRGCAFGCTYCTYSFLGGPVFRMRPVQAVLDDIRAISGTGAGSFQFVDSVFNAPAGYFRELVKAIADDPTGMSWGAWLDTSVTDEDLAAMAAAGAVKVDFSPDAVTDAGMRRLGKRDDPRALWSRVRAARRAGLSVGVNFFVGNPGEGFAALLLKVAFMLRARLLLGWSRTFVNIGTVRVYAHSRLASEMKAAGLAPGGFLPPVFLEPKGLSASLFRGYQRLRRGRHEP